MRSAGLLLVGTIALPLFSGCRSDKGDRSGDSAAPPFVFRTLDLRQQDMGGRPTWRLTSPEARYDLRRQVAQAERPEGTIYAAGKPSYRLQAASGTVLNDGEVVLLEGGIRVEQLGARPLLIRALRARWLTRQNLLEIDRYPEVSEAYSLLRARRASFRFDQDQLQLRGEPRLLRWEQRIDPLRQQRREQPETVMVAREVDWSPRRGRLQARGPVQAARRVPGRPASQPLQSLIAASLDGDTRREIYWLRGPVQWQDPVERSRLQAGDVRLDLAQRTADSTLPFLGMRGDLQASGEGFRVEESQQRVSIPIGCRLLQRGDALRADSCSWNWSTQQVEAKGAVELRRQAQQQLTRGSRLVGRLGPQGALTLTNPGGRVISRLVVPRRAAAPPPPPRQRRAPEPIRL
ncbi:MAG: LPS export ABC transporter periplasmic protein LptC [Cyanobium sp.]